jgi:hypothetical protein
MLVRAKRSGEPKGASYRYVDYMRGAKRGLTYRLQLVDLKGKRTWYAAFAIASSVRFWGSARSRGRSPTIRRQPAFEITPVKVTEFGNTNSEVPCPLARS